MSINRRSCEGPPVCLEKTAGKEIVVYVSTGHPVIMVNMECTNKVGYRYCFEVVGLLDENMSGGNEGDLFDFNS